MTEKVQLSSTPVLHTTLRWGAIIGGVVIVLAGATGWIVAESAGMWSGVIGASVGVLFPAFTAISIVIANRWYGTPTYLTTFFAIVLGFWLLKFLIVLVLLLSLQSVSWIVPIVFFFSLVGAAIASLVVDLVVLQRMRLPAVSDITLPAVNPEEEQEQNP
ncbi:hypothetical protein [Microbacterium sp. YY-01]|uniref:hypothetical protein n=1 Tax=Microbacterium sp. YY-01 TaxID=3421634 RepID=UPI003D16C24E